MPRKTLQLSSGRRLNKMQEIPPYGTDTNDAAFDVNEKNQVVGNSFNVNALTARATLWQNNTLNDLNTLVIQPTSLYLTLAQGINDAGEIAGTAIDTTTNETVGSSRFPYSTAAAIQTSRPRPKRPPIRVQWFSPNVCESSCQFSFA